MNEQDYRNETEDLLLRLRAGGFQILLADNGENTFAWSEDLVDGRGLHQEFVDEAMACDESVIRIRHIGTQKKASLFLAYGNSAGELVADYSVLPELETVIDGFYAANSDN